MFIRKLFRKQKPQSSASSVYNLIPFDRALFTAASGWSLPDVALKQHECYQSLIKNARQGRVRIDLAVAAEAVKRTGLNFPELVEIGCGSGYYFEVFSYLTGQNLTYTGVDQSPAMIRLARKSYPRARFIAGNAAGLPFRNNQFDIAFNGVSLMHTFEYRAAISEMRRVTRRWCIFHTVPVLQQRATTGLTKTAYGSGVVAEIIFNEAELLRLFDDYQLRVVSTAESIEYNLETILGEKTMTKTYLCEVASNVRT